MNCVYCIICNGKESFQKETKLLVSIHVHCRNYLSETQSRSTGVVYTHPGKQHVRVGGPFSGGKKKFGCYTDPLPIAIPSWHYRVLFPRLPFPNVIKILARDISP